LLSLGQLITFYVLGYSEGKKVVPTSQSEQLRNAAIRVGNNFVPTSQWEQLRTAAILVGNNFVQTSQPEQLRNAAIRVGCTLNTDKTVGATT
jgi:hypothetical protein